jgi:hypothetical protein
MHALRRARLTTWSVVLLLWATFGMAVLSPWLAHRTSAWLDAAVCSVGVSSAGAASESGTTPQDAAAALLGHHLDCPLCLPFAAPPSGVSFMAPEPLAQHALSPVASLPSDRQGPAHRWAARAPPAQA